MSEWCARARSVGAARRCRRLAAAGGTPITPAMLFVAFGLVVGPQVLDGIDLSSTGAAVRSWRRRRLRWCSSATPRGSTCSTLRRRPTCPVRLLGIGLALTIVSGRGGRGVLFGAAERRGGGRARDRPGADRCRARPGGRHRAARAAEDPPGTQRRERPQRRDLRAAAVLGWRPPTSSPRDRRPQPRRLLVEEIGYGVARGVVAGLLIAAVVDRLGGPAGPDLRGLAPDRPGRRRRPGLRHRQRARRVRLHRGVRRRHRLRAWRCGATGGDRPAQRGGGRRPQRGHLRALRGRPARARARRAQLAARAIRRSQPDARAHGPGRHRDVGTHARRPTVGFLGWFGPRGLASIVFAVIVVEESNLPHAHLIVLAIYLTVGLSVLAHGLTAAPLAAPLRLVVRVASIRCDAGDGERSCRLASVAVQTARRGRRPREDRRLRRLGRPGALRARGARRRCRRASPEPVRRPADGSSHVEPAAGDEPRGQRVEFHISPVCSSSRPQTGVGTCGTRSSSRPAQSGSSLSRADSRRPRRRPG